MQTFAPAERRQYLKRFGAHCLAHASLQAGMGYFDLPGVGYIAYSSYCGTRFALAEPLCADADRATLLQAALAEHGETCFVQVREPFARLLCEHGFFATPIGVEVTLDLADYSLSGPSKQNIRTAANRINRSGAVVRELPCDQVKQADLHRISTQWLGRKANRRELRFMTRPAVYADEPEVRKFFLFDNSDAVSGFVFFDPIYCGGRVVGYVSDINRALRETPKGYDYAITAQAIEAFKGEGKTTLSLGLCPMAGKIPSQSAGQNWLAARAGACFKGFLNDAMKRLRGTPLYSFRGLYEHKSEYRGREELVYFCSRSWFQLREAMGLLKICNVL